QAHERNILGNFDLFAHLSHAQGEIGTCVLAYNEANAGADALGESFFGDPDLVSAHGHGEEPVAPGLVGRSGTRVTGIEIFSRYGCAGDRRAGRVGDYSRQVGRNLCPKGWQAKRTQKQRKSSGLKDPAQSNSLDATNGTCNSIL